MSHGHQDKQHIHTVHNVTYDDIKLCYDAEQKQNDVVDTTTNSPTHTYAVLESVSNRVDDIYVEKDDGDYDHLHSNRQKPGASDVEEDRYGKACHLEDSYALLSQNKKDEPDLNNDYNSIVIYGDNSCSSVDNSDYSHCYQAESI